MSNRPLGGESSVSRQAVGDAEYVKRFFEAVPDRVFAFERIIAQGSWGYTLLMTMKTNDTPQTRPTQAPSQAPGLQPLPSLPDSFQSLSISNPITRLFRPSEGDPASSFGRGSFGFAPQLPRPPRPPRRPESVTRFVLKRSLAEVGEKNITKEIDALDRLRGYTHFAQPSHVLEDTRWQKVSQDLKGPTLLMDWVENGLLWAFYEKRMVVGLAWPARDLGGRPGGASGSEAIPAPNERGERPPKSRLLHGDFHAQNIMVDTLEPVEHRFIPVLKLIDFGTSRDLPVRPNEPEGLVVKTNIRAIGEVMLGLLRGNIKGGPGMMEITYKGETRAVNSYATDLDRLSNRYRAPAYMVAQHQERIDNLDPEIRSLVALCVAVRPEDRPDIEDLLGIVEEKARNKKRDDYLSYKYSDNETEAAIRDIVERYMFDADRVAPGFLS
ncbi:hypothetical protein EKO27_g2455 [Xylaria grammica]|uniref:Protein kinase domain-containing protein n=1 Tax=Xylaria grammica TaxID=363999 RepID=A0A439DE02_9PEZI|nr:hypothetical protein EKO27_g2455 [Xylaria grammica]